MEYYFLKVPAINALRKQLFLFAHQQSKAPVSTGENGENLWTQHLKFLQGMLLPVWLHTQKQMVQMVGMAKP